MDMAIPIANPRTLIMEKSLLFTWFLRAVAM
jgi:hypothetical protein